MLLESDAAMNQVTTNGSCLHEAALYGKTDVVKLLLDVSESNNVLYFHGFSSGFHALFASKYHCLFDSSGASMQIKINKIYIVHIHVQPS